MLAFDGELGNGPAGDEDVDLYRFDATVGDMLTAETLQTAGSVPVDTGLLLFDDLGNPLAFDDDSGSDLFYSRIDFTFDTAGTFFIGVSGFENYFYNPVTGLRTQLGDTGDYELTLTLVPETGDLLDAAVVTGLTTAGGDVSFQEALGNGPAGNEDVDLYQFQAAVGDTLTAETLQTAGSVPVDTGLLLFDDLGNPLAFDDDSGSDLFYSRIDFTFDTAGTFFIGVSGFDNYFYDPVTGLGTQPGDTGDYELTLTLVPDPGDILTDALDTGLGPADGSFSRTETLGNGLAGETDVDLFRFQANAGSTLFAETTLPAGAIPGDTVLRLFDEFGVELAFNDDRDPLAGDFFSEIFFPFTSDGIYFIGVSGFNNDVYDPVTGAFTFPGTTGDYTLTLTLQTAEIHGRKFNDFDGDGFQDAGEPGIEGVTIFLDLNQNGLLDVPSEPFTLTDINGDYLFTGVLPGVYFVREIVPAGAEQTFPLTGDFAQIFRDPTPAVDEEFGNRVATLGGSGILVSADEANGGEGEVHLFNALDGAFQGTFLLPNPAAHTAGFRLGFGGSITTIGSNLVLIGAEGADTGATDAGEAYLFDATNGNLLDTFSNPDPGIDDAFGISTAALGTSLVAIAADLDDPFGVIDAGRVYVFDLNNNGDLLLALDNPNPDQGDRFGSAITAADQNRLVVGAPSGETDSQFPVTRAGEAYLFDALTGNLLQTFVSPSSSVGDLFGAGVGAVGNIVLISAPLDDSAGRDAGAVHAFDATTGGFLRSFFNPNPTGGEIFGISGTVVGTDQVLIGAVADPDNDVDLFGAAAGKAYLFDLNTADLLAVFNSPVPQFGDSFAFSIAALDNDTVVVGASGTELSANETGTAFLFELNPLRPAAQVVSVGPGEIALNVNFGNRVAGGDIHGTKFNDFDGDGVQDPNELGLEDVTIFLDLNENGFLDTTDVTNTFSSADVPVDILDDDTVTSDLTVNGLSGPISDVNVTLDIEHTFPPDLEVFLISPAGTRVQLFSEVLDDNDDNFTNTTLDDEASDPIFFGNAPFTGSFQPDSPLSALDGEDPNGAWQLEITDLFAIDSGTLLDWSLEIATEVPIEPTTRTDAVGNYRFLGLPPDTYSVGEVLQPGWEQTFPPTAQLIVNGSFESGNFFGWTTNITGDASEPWQVVGAGLGDGFGIAATEPQDGQFLAFNGFDGDEPIEFSMFQDVTLPVGEPATLTFQGRVQWDFTLGETATLPRTFSVEIRDPATDAILDVPFTFSTGTQASDPIGDTEFETISIDLSAFAGSTVRVFFREDVPEAFTGPGQVEIDAISLFVPSPFHTVDVGVGDVIEDIDFGNRQITTGELYGTKFIDFNGNGFRESNEPGQEGVTIFLDLNANGVLDVPSEPFTLTDADGNYRFLNLPPDTYTVAEVVPAGFIQTAPSGSADFGDTIDAAFDTGLSSTSPGTFTASAFIGDNPSVLPGFDVDMFGFQLDAGGRVTVDIDTNPFGTSLDSILRLFDANGNQVAFNDDDQFSFDSLLNFTARVAGTYFVGVSDFVNDFYDPFVPGTGDERGETGQYDISIEVAAGVGAVVIDEPHDTINTAFDSGLSSANTGIFRGVGEIGDNPSFAPGLDVDMIAFQLDAGDRVLIDVDADVNGSFLDSIARLFEENGNELAFSDDDPAPGEDPFFFDSFIDFTAIVSGTYFVGISAFPNGDLFSEYDPLVAGSGFEANPFDLGVYSVTIEVIGNTVAPPEPNDTIGTAVETGLSSAIPGKYIGTGEIGDNPNFAPGLDVDMYAFQLDAGGQVLIDVDADATGSQLDSIARLFDLHFLKKRP